MWLLFMLAAVANGGFRDFVLSPRLGEMGAHLVSTAILCLVIFAGSWVLVRMQRVQGTQTLLQVGVMWLVGTVLFEFLFGHYVVGHSWQRLLADYNLLNGRVWVLVLVTEMLGPLAAARLQARRRTVS